MALKLIISDLDGTLVETEDYHRRAYNLLFQELGLDVFWSKQDYIDRLTVMGGGNCGKCSPGWVNLKRNLLSLRGKCMIKKHNYIFNSLPPTLIMAPSV